VAAAFARFDLVQFFIWGYLKKGLKETITQQVAAIPPEMTHRIMEKYWERLSQFIDIEGRHLSDVVFKF
jgi:hypothetical protein